jgi:hypothetical protein
MKTKWTWLINAVLAASGCAALAYYLDNDPNLPTALTVVPDGEAAQIKAGAVGLQYTISGCTAPKTPNCSGEIGWRTTLHQGNQTAQTEIPCGGSCGVNYQTLSTLPPEG